MATLNLTAPTSGQNVVVITEVLDTLNLGFDTSTALFEKSGNDFIITFEDGTSICLQGFYDVYTSEFIPDFIMNDTLISGEDFFAAFDSNLMPAAGAEANSSARNSADATNNLESDLVVGNANIGTGLTSLGGVDGYNANAADGLFMINEAGTYVSEAPEVTIPTDPPAPPLPPIFTGDREITAFESEIENNTTVDWTVPDGYEIVGVVGQGDYGKAEIVDGKLEYELDEAFDHSSTDGNVAAKGDTITVIVKDSLGNEMEVEINVAIVDDEPTISGDNLGNVTEGGTITGKLDIDYGADGKGSLTVNGVEADEDGTFDVGFGKVTIDDDGNFTLQVDPNYEGDPNQTLEVEISDSEGDKASVKVEVTIDQATAPSDLSVSVDESDVLTNATTSWTPPAGFEIVTAENGFLGNVTVNADGSLSYELNDAIDHTGANGDVYEGADSITVTLKDSNGNLIEVEVRVDVNDDVPTLSTEDTSFGLTEGASVSGKLDMDFGADGMGSITVNGKAPSADGSYDLGYGKVTIEADGSYTVTVNPDYTGSGNESLNFEITDGDGDKANVTVDVNIAQAEAPDVSDMDINANEANIGTADATVSWTPPAGFEIVTAGGSSLGNVTVNADGSLSYELDTTHTHTGEGADIAQNADSVTVVLRDENGNEFEVTVDVNVKDDVPTISGDNLGSVTEGTTVSGQIDIDFGADGAAATGSITVNGVEANQDGVFDLGFGTVILGENGSYELTINPNFNADSADLTFTVTDADGDSVSHTVQVNVQDANAPDISDRDTITADEGNIGSDTPTINWQAPDGYTIVNVTNGTLGNASIVDGEVHYELGQAVEHTEQGADLAQGADKITITLKDENGNTFDVVISVDIVDDMPTIESTELAPVTEGSSVSGQLNIDFGADGGSLASLTINGQEGVSSFSQSGNLIYNFDFGTVIVSADGSYTVNVNPNYEGNGENLVFEVTDGDGDKTSTTVNVTINQAGEPDISDNNTITADEANIGTADATVNWTPPAGYEIVTAGGSSLGNVTVNADGSLSYELDSTHTHTGEGADIAQNADSVTVVLRDENGNEFEVTIDVNVKDDVPTISGDNLGSATEGTTVTGQLTIDFGADGGSMDSLTINGQSANENGEYVFDFGTVTVSPDGSYSVAINSNFTGNTNQNLEFSITDADGDTASTNVSLNIQDAAAPDVSDMDINADEANIGTADATVNWTPPAGYEIVTAGGSSLGNVVVNADGSLSYELDSTHTHTGEGADIAQNADSVTVVLRDENGNEFEVTVDVNVKDDVPTIESVSDLAPVQEGGTVSGKLEIDFGADGAHAEAMTVNGVEANANGEFVLDFGTVVVAADGSYTLTVNPNYEGDADRTLNFTVQDADGDIASTTVDVVIEQVDIPSDTNLNITADEAGIENNATVNWQAPDGFTIIAVANGTLGNANIVDGKLEYELNTAITHDKAEGEDQVVENADTVTVVLKDANGNLVEVQVNVSVKDDVPTIESSSLDSVEEGSSVSGQLDIDFGADGAGSLTVNGVEANTDGEYVLDFGTVTVSPDGSYTVAVNPNYEGNGESLTFEVTDADGDTASTTVDVNISQASAPDDTDFRIEADEDGIASNETVSWTPPAGYEIVGVEIKSDSPYGNASFENGELVYELDSTVSHNQQGEDVTLGDTVTVTLKDANGNLVEVEVKVDVRDSVPTISGDNLGSVVEGATVTGQLTIDFGADGGSMDSLTINGQSANENGEFVFDFGTVTVSPDGSYSVAINSNFTGDTNQNLEFSITDADGDTASTNVSLNIQDAAAPDVSDMDINADEANIGTADATVNWTPPAGFEIVTAGGSSLGNVVVNEDGSLSYELDTTHTHTGEGADIAQNADSVTVVLRDENGNEFEVTVDVNVKDDVPTITGDDFSVTEGQSYEGKLDIDFGADGGSMDSLTINGQSANEDGEFVLDFGTVTVSPDGSYTVAVNPNYEGTGESLTFEVTDADGDTASTTVDVNITQAGAPDVSDMDIEANEANIGTENSTVTWTPPAGFEIVTAGGSSLGNVVVNEDGSLSYKLNTTHTHTGEGADVAENADSVTVVLRDENGNEFEVTVDVNVKDDVPTITGDDFSVTEGQSYEGQLDIDFGADGAGSISIKDAILNEDGTYDVGFGKVTINADGSYTVQVNPNYTGSGESIEFVVTDGDGDSVSHTVDVTIDQAQGPDDTDFTITADEDDIATDTVVTWTPPAGFEIVGFETDSSIATVVVDENGNLSYELDSTIDHGNTDLAVGADKITVTVQDADGNTFEVTVNVDIVDSLPTISSDNLDSVMEGTSVSGQLDIDFGADGGSMDSLTINGQSANEDGEFVLDFGTVTVSPDGSYTVQVNPNYEGNGESLEFVVTDGDGDKASTTVDVNITQATAPEADFTITADEANIGTENSTVTWTPPAGYEIVTAGGSSLGNVVVNEDGTLSYELDKAIDHTGEGADTKENADSITVTLKDEFGNEVEITVDVNVKDDVPTISGSTLDSVEEGTSVSGKLDIDFGADGAAATGSITVNGVEANAKGEYELDFGKVTIDADGNYTLVVDPNYEGNGESLEFVVTDADGDTASTTVDVNITQATLPDTDLTIEANEAGIENNATVNWTPPAGYEIVSATGAVLGSVTIVNGNVQYELNGTVEHDAQGTDLAINADSITVTLKDPNGNFIEVEIQVDVRDDVPTISGDNFAVTEGHTYEGKVDIDFGADGGSMDSLTINGQSANEDGEFVFDFGTVTIDADGNYTLVANPNYEGNGESLTFEVTDADGDTGSVTIDVNIEQAKGPNEDDLQFDADEAEIENNATSTWTPPAGFEITGIVTTNPLLGTVYLDEDGNLVYELNKTHDHTGEGADIAQAADKITVTMQDQYGNNFEVDVRVNVTDDVPTINAPVLGGVEAGYNVTGKLEIDFGADGGSLDSLTINGITSSNGIYEIEGFGTITVNPDGTYLLEVNDDYRGKGEELVFEITDNDGDKASTKIEAQTQIMNFYYFDDAGLVDWDNKDKNYEEDGVLQKIETLYGTSGDDVVTGHYLSGTFNSIETGAGNDTINIGMKDKNFTDAGYEVDHFGGMSGGTIDAGDGDDTINVHEISGGTILAGAGNDTVNIGGVDDVITGYMQGGSIYTGDGDDTVNIKDIGGGLVDTGADNDLVTVGNMRAGTITLGSGDDTIIVESLSNAPTTIISGGEGSDTFIYANNAGNTIVLDDSGNIYLNNITHSGAAQITGFENVGGGAGNDTIYGNSSDNVIIGGQGSDIMFGGGGDDTFLFRDGDFTVGATDTIMDFNEGDMLDLRAFIDNGMTATTTVDASGNVVVQVGDDASGYQNIVLEGLGNNDKFDLDDFNNSLNNDGFIKM